MKTKVKKVSIKEYADKYNPELSRRGHKMTFSYLYRIIREDMAGTGTRELWFKYVLEGPYERIWIIVN